MAKKKKKGRAKGPKGTPRYLKLVRKQIEEA